MEGERTWGGGRDQRQKFIRDNGNIYFSCSPSQAFEASVLMYLDVSEAVCY